MSGDTLLCIAVIYYITSIFYLFVYRISPGAGLGLGLTLLYCSSLTDASDVWSLAVSEDLLDQFVSSPVGQV